MAADQQILREYLVALGFHIDQTGERKVDNIMHSLDKSANLVGKGLIGVATAAVTMTHQFGKSMERMFYSARYADTTVGRLQALEFGFRNIGGAGGQAAATLKNFTAAVRANPGLNGLLEKLGVPVKGRTMDKVMLDFVRATKTMPSYIAQRYAGLFGMDPETLFNMQQGLDKMEAAMHAREQMAKDMGVDPDQIKNVAVEYMNLWRGITEQAGIFGQVIGAEMLDKMKDLAATTSDLMRDWVRIVHEINSAGTTDFWQKLREGVTGRAEGDRVTLNDDARKRIGAPMYDIQPDDVDPKLGHVPRWKRWLKKIAPKQFDFRPPTDAAAVETVTAPDPVNSMTEAQRVRLQRLALETQNRNRSASSVVRRPSNVVVADPAAGDTSPGGVDYDMDASPQDAGDTSPGGVDQPGFDPEDYLADLEKKYHLPPGILDRIWKKESRRGDPKFMLSPKGAKGHFGFMPKTAKEFGIEGKEDDFKASGDAAARKMAGLMARYKGDARLAAAAYNWGEGNLASINYKLGRAPAETRDYADSVGGPAPAAISQNTEVHVHGVSDPGRAADIVVQRQREANADLARNLSPKVR